MKVIFWMNAGNRSSKLHFDPNDAAIIQAD